MPSLCSGIRIVFISLRRPREAFQYVAEKQRIFAWPKALWIYTDFILVGLDSILVGLDLRWMVYIPTLQSVSLPLNLLNDQRVSNKNVILYQYSFFCKSLNSLKILNSGWFFDCLKRIPRLSAAMIAASRCRAPLRRRWRGRAWATGGYGAIVYSHAHRRGF